MSAPDLSRLKALALAATPGEWRALLHGRVVGGPLRQYVNGSAQAQVAAFSVTFHDQAPDDEPERQQANAEFCAAANPAAILHLLALHDDRCTEVLALMERLRTAEAESARQRADIVRLRAIETEYSWTRNPDRMGS